MSIPIPFWSLTGDAARAALTAQLLRRGVYPTPDADPPLHTTQLLAFFLLFQMDKPSMHPIKGPLMARACWLYFALPAAVDPIESTRQEG